jgi:hypothetical protein
MMDEARLSPGVMFVGRYRIPPGAVDAWRAANQELTEFVAGTLPDVLAFDAYLSEDRTIGTSTHLHRSAASFEAYLVAAAARIGRGAQIVQVESIDLYGDPGPELVDRIRRMGTWPVRVHEHVNGFGRSRPA